MRRLGCTAFGVPCMSGRLRLHSSFAVLEHFRQTYKSAVSLSEHIHLKENTSIKGQNEVSDLVCFYEDQVLTIAVIVG